MLLHAAGTQRVFAQTDAVAIGCLADRLRARAGVVVVCPGRPDAVARGEKELAQAQMLSERVMVPVLQKSQELPRKFESFRRASHVGDIQGAGLGLAIVKSAVDLHGGTIEVRADAGRGTVFTVRLGILGKAA